MEPKCWSSAAARSRRRFQARRSREEACSDGDYHEAKQTPIIELANSATMKLTRTPMTICV